MPTSSHMVANFEFSLKNPKPGWIASAPVRTAADKTALPPVIGVGGVTFEKLDELRNAGFAGAAMLGALYK